MSPLEAVPNASFAPELGRDGTGTLVQGDCIYRRRRLRRSDPLQDSEFITVLAVCDVLAERSGSAHVRWVVAFLA